MQTERAFYRPVRSDPLQVALALVALRAFERLLSRGSWSDGRELSSEDLVDLERLWRAILDELR